MTINKCWKLGSSLCFAVSLYQLVFSLLRHRLFLIQKNLKSFVLQSHYINWFCQGQDVISVKTRIRIETMLEKSIQYVLQCVFLFPPSFLYNMYFNVCFYSHPVFCIHHPTASPAVLIVTVMFLAYNLYIFKIYTTAIGNSKISGLQNKKETNLGLIA